MPIVTVRGGFDTFAGSINPSREHGDDKFLRVLAGDQYAYVYLKNPAPRGATIVSATLRLRVRGASTGARTLTARRIADSWKASKLNWNNKPGVTGAWQPTATIGTVVDGDVIEFDVAKHLQTVVDGSPHYGWRIETDAATMHKLYGLDAGTFKPTLTVTWSDKPGTPTSLAPSGVVSVDKPVLQFDYSDLQGDELIAVRVQIDPAANGSSPAFASGEVATTEPELDLSTTSYAGLADGASTQWRVQVKDAGGLWSEWSDWATFSRDVKGTLSIDNPAASPNNFVNEPTPPILATLTGETLAAYQIRVTAGDDRTHVLYDSGKVKASGTTISHTIPQKWEGKRVLRDDRNYQVNVRAWDTKDREATPGDPVFVAEWRTFKMDDDLTVAAPTLTAAQVGLTPWVELTFTRTTAPDSWTILRDGKVIEAQIDPADVLESGTTYKWRDHTASPRDAHTYNVKAIVNGRQSGKSNDATVTTKPAGVWVIDFERDLAAMIVAEVPAAEMVDQSVTYRPIGASRPVKITNGLTGLSGTVEGVFVYSEQDVDALEATMWKFKERPDEVYQLVYGDLSIPVLLADISVSPHAATSRHGVVKAVRFRFDQFGDLPFDARI